MNNRKCFAVIVILSCLIGMPVACSSSGDSPASRNEEVLANTAAPDPRSPADVRLDFSLTNFTGTSLQAVYLSPIVSPGWEENILAGSALKDGGTVDIRFDVNEKSTVWDMRVEGADGYHAEWKNLQLGDISKMTLFLKMSPEPTAVAEIE